MEEKPKTARKPELIECEVMRAIGVDMSDKEKDSYRETLRNGKELMSMDGLTKMIYPSRTNKPNTVMLEKKIAKKLQNAGAVRVLL